MMDYGQKMQKCIEYVEALEVERQKIQVFQRELPLCFELVSQAVDACRQQLSSPAAVGTSHEGFNVRRQQSVCSEQTSNHGPPVLEEFIPMKKFESCSSDDGGGGDGQEEEDDESREKSGKKSDWLRTVQLWNQSPDPAEPVSEAKKTGGSFRPLDEEKVVLAIREVEDRRPVEDKPASSTTVKSMKEESNKNKESGQTQRKQRRCWSPELHRRFIHSLQQLGGTHVATPKQIKELMKVDGLTNDEVKSHLQKYRLHMRRPSATLSNSSYTQGPQLLVVGGIWVPPSECPAAGATAATTTSSANQGETNNMKKEDNWTLSSGAYAPVATAGTPFARPASKMQNKSQKSHSTSHSEDDGSHSAHVGGRGRSSSPSSSCSTHTTAIATASPGF